MLKEVKVKVGDEFIRGALYKGELLIKNVIEVGDTINVDGKEMKVLSSSIDTRDNLLKINLAEASKPKKEKKSDGKQIKG
jgi:hypothetical protein